ncbi:hypothetical protein KQI42_20025 [Tissierella sp. MSJ-40]|uniref:YqbQ/XkdQ domain-containing protein n=1 Tax=Tissierella simiarum TaxID=2841534 RepID=A0ABS6ECN2_9FIRM|nr:hypothetical protein [Tissierella simiarum]MBU5440286.1 hypothetical protein [Tissierella simiarum]
MEIIIESRGKTFDISHLCSDVEWKTEINKAATLKVNVQKVDELAFFEGDTIKLTDKDRKLFKGYIFKKERDKNQIIEITAYDQLRYLKNKDTFIFKNKTATEIATHIFKQFQLKYKEVENTSFKIDKLVEDNKTLLDIIQGALDLTLVNTGKIYIMYDDFGHITIKNIDNLRTDLVIGDESLATNFKYTTSIDNDVYNKIKLFKDNKKTGKRDTYIVYDSNNIKKWGILQYTEKLNEKILEGKAKQQAENLLKVRNRLRRTLSIDCIGDIRLRAGNSVGVFIKDLGDISVNQLMIIDSVTHKWKGNHHTMDLNLIYE